MAREYTPLPFEFLEELDCLDDAEYGRLVRAMQRYSIDGTEAELTGSERLFWKRCKNTVDRYRSSYEKRYASNAENGAKGGRPKKPSGFSETEENPKNPTGFFETQKSQTKTKTKTKTESKTDIPPKPPEGFDLFWQSYPKKVGKEAARKAFCKVNVPVESLLTAIERQKCGRQWQEDGGKYIPNPATWLNQGRWEDEVPVEAAGDGGRRALDADEQAAIRRMFGGRRGQNVASGELGEAELEAIQRVLAQEEPKTQKGNAT